MFIESVAGILIVTPILLPIATSWGGPGPLWDYNGSKSGAGSYDTASRGKPIYCSSHCRRFLFEEEVKASIPFLIAGFAALAVITYVEPLSLWLPASWECNYVAGNVTVWHRSMFN